MYSSEEEITEYLSLLLTNTEHHELLYSASSSVLQSVLPLFADADALTLFHSLSSALYISELVRVSMFIPSESSSMTAFDEFSTYSHCVDNPFLDQLRRRRALQRRLPRALHLGSVLWLPIAPEAL